MPKIKYQDESAKYKVRYAKYKSSGDLIHEIISIYPDSSRMRALIAMMRAGDIFPLEIKTGYCWAVDENCNYVKHLTLDPQTISGGCFVVKSGRYHRGMSSGLDEELERLCLRGKMQASKEDPVMSLSFGPRVPADYYGDHDYSMYPGGYTPHKAY
ncbi:hypothetical protein [Pseudomonas sp. MM227]|uniref:hypothetical protein n=1 Tax=Pseudomonas sp. MM227 TaxID=3019968 RepID=UPI00221EDE09|nr:hypothetical protein [Pseudomonas sp. MM227]